MNVVVRPMVSSDLDAVLDIQRACYGEGFLEGADVITRRIASPVGLSCVTERGGRVCAYLAAYASHPGKLTPLHGDFEAMPLPSILYLHDLAVHPQAAGLGLAQALVRHLWTQAWRWGWPPQPWCRCRARRTSGPDWATRCRPWATRASSGGWRPTALVPATWCVCHWPEKRIKTVLCGGFTSAYSYEFHSYCGGGEYPFR